MGDTQDLTRSLSTAPGGEEPVLVLSTYPIGRKIIVHYHPQRHEFSVLEPGFYWTNLFGFVFPGAFILGLWLLAVLLARRNRARLQRERKYAGESREIL